jgi:hypothetical protein
MTISNIIGSIGVALLLLAYFLSLFRWISQQSNLYAALNIVGAGLSCYASLMIGFMPFVILEGIWAIVALIGLFRKPVTA